ncbi:diguanylate phosphodiesterase [Brevibacillus reuszeri]|uniref:Diguanylate phosphodiesterase n=1 Tax=Brevibacillus reuszeri TaxID=54915 RepID=A0ABQ0TSN9_9BACL|nr:ABC transporter substrate-binding protein [Brevibacillus reuszeri]MED1861377.1 ABC transporter substrate-binding protein [Brevibacillus reuszeri]GED69918.1 diguanylate phosphodiesterase [Brevibacillus reuszeri]
MLNIRKTFVTGFSILAVLSMVLTGCGSSVTPAPTTTGSAQATTEAQPKDSGQTEKVVGGTVRVAMATEPDNLDPYLSAATDTSSMMDNVFDGLFEAGENSELVPAIAESYQVTEDGLTYTFKIRKGIKFHDGSDLTAEDVQYSYAKLSGLNGKEPLSAKFAAIEKIDTPDDFTVVVKLKEKDAAFLAANIIAIVPKDYEKQSEKPIGAGPFKFSSYTPGQQLVLERNDQFYEQEKKPALERIEFKIMPDSNASVLAMQSGDIDMIPGISDQGAKQLGAGFQIVSGPQNMVQLMALNNSVKPLNDVRVRQAINYAIDKDVIIQTVAEGNGVKLGSNMSPAMKRYYQEGLTERYQTDVEKAKALLKEAGYEKGFKLAITVPSNYSFHVDTAQVIAEQLKAVGIEAEIKQIEWSSWLEDVYNNAKYEATIIGLTGKLDPHEVLGRFETTYRKNFYKFSNAEFDDLVNRGRTEVDETKRADLYKEAQTILTEQAVAVFIMDPSRSVALKENLHGFKMYPVQKYDFAAMYFSKK